MGILSKITNALGGSLVGEVLDTVKEYFPPDMPPEKVAEMEARAKEIENQKLEIVNNAIAESEKAINRRIEIYEGTASDLKSIPVLGPIMLFIRGAQRPVWGFAALYLDFMVFAGQWKITDDTISTSFMMMNILVLGFLFGERAVKNVTPLLTNFIKSKNGMN